ncbi:hypothetical protein SADUNF_Sadunf19G0092500 [Salix dunnii]|uniref:Uncharacterized protein n=1 Tax=Salix dunnii TaxID=1413687 RepID=A0A835IZ83_9ROSI|nr:hypothetical protein SADUNF_Sadunf19G0092500 [Salix dunnii]
MIWVCWHWVTCFGIFRTASGIATFTNSSIANHRRGRIGANSWYTGKTCTDHHHGISAAQEEIFIAGMQEVHLCLSFHPVQMIKFAIAVMESDENGRGTNCPNTCVMGGNSEYKAGNYISHIDLKESKKGPVLEEFFQKARDILGNDTLKTQIIPRCGENNVTNELILVLTRIEGDNHPTGGYPCLCSDLQYIIGGSSSKENATIEENHHHTSQTIFSKLPYHAPFVLLVNSKF